MGSKLNADNLGLFINPIGYRFKVEDNIASLGQGLETFTLLKNILFVDNPIKMQVKSFADTFLFAALQSWLQAGSFDLQAA